ncbi:hypothetical protein BLA13014_04258 [Burkholderia aenigmatica]|uniref:Uncharacterized protein n=1 Tax=Burkholderia aenigmatica TaxID=2015348 RepID=A0A6P2NFI2_9BURK|nr:hypothetical protein BLA13014_04258 [Burkholderia aenigmatica]
MDRRAAVKRATAFDADAVNVYASTPNRLPGTGWVDAAHAARHQARCSSGGSDVAINPMPIAINTPNASRRNATGDSGGG